MYPALARFGYGLVKSLRPSKVKKALKPLYEKATKKSIKSGKMSGYEDKLIKGIKGASSKAFQGYRSLYKGTLGSSARRKTTAAGTGGYMLGSFLSGDDKDI